MAHALSGYRAGQRIATGRTCLVGGYVLDGAGSIVLLAVSIVAASMWGRLAERWRHARSRQSVHT